MSHKIKSKSIRGTWWLECVVNYHINPNVIKLLIIEYCDFVPCKPKLAFSSIQLRQKLVVGGCAKKCGSKGRVKSNLDSESVKFMFRHQESIVKASSTRVNGAIDILPFPQKFISSSRLTFAPSFNPRMFSIENLLHCFLSLTASHSVSFSLLCSLIFTLPNRTRHLILSTFVHEM